MNGFHPLVEEWFRNRYGDPTEIQRTAWPAIAAGEHVLLSAPTGTGKTLAAFLSALSRLVSGEWETGGLAVLYVSPLKALATDIRENLTEPLQRLREMFSARGLFFPDIRTDLRTGDTPREDRRRMIRRPPEILVTTPESLAILLLSADAENLFRMLRLVILDEIHALLTEKRGTLLASGIERLTRIAGEFQRIAVSATLRDPGEAALFAGGLLPGPDGKPVPRAVRVIRAEDSKRLDLSILTVEEIRPGETVWQPLARRLLPFFREKGKTLVFVNSRRAAERLALLVNEGENGLLVYPHHGSLSRELRSDVERRLKTGELRGVVATSSLELGIDIGSLDRVVLVETPFSASSAVQRIGRAGHRVGVPSVGVFFPVHDGDLLRAAVTADMAAEGDIEAATVPENPLDVLAQILVAMTVSQPLTCGELYDFVRRIHPFRNLPRRAFDSVVDMLAGAYENLRVPELRARVRRDPETDTIAALPGARLLLLTSGGAIPQRGSFKLTAADSGAVLGEVDEEFVWERRVGDRFHFGNRAWKITAIGDSAVSVTPWSGPVNTAVFWKGEPVLSSFHTGERIGLFLEEAEKTGVPHGRFLGNLPAERLGLYLGRQRAATGTGLPHRRRLLVEYTAAGAGGLGAAVLHTFWGGAVNLPLALILRLVIAESGIDIDVHADNEGAAFLFPGAGSGGPDIADLLRGMDPEDVPRLAARALEGSGFFGARFRENLGRALLLPTAGAGRRIPFWLLRRKARALYEKVSGFRDFPVTAETRRQCLTDFFDLPRLASLLAEIRSGAVEVAECRTRKPSPFAEGIVRSSVDDLMYAGEESPGGKAAEPDPGLLFDPRARANGLLPFESGALEEFSARLARTAPGYAPPSKEELLDWLGTRIFLEEQEWESLRDRIRADGGGFLDSPETETFLRDRSVVLPLPGSRVPVRLTWENAALIHLVLGAKPGPPASSPRYDRAAARVRASGLPEPESLFAAWLYFRKPTEKKDAAALWGLSRERLDGIVAALLQENRIVEGQFTAQAEEEICSSETFERLLRFLRARRREAAPRVPPARLASFLAETQGLAGPEKSPERILEMLLAYPADAGDWETRILPARLPGYSPGILDAVLLESDLEWFGAGRGRAAFRLPGDPELFADRIPAEPGRISDAFADPRGAYKFRDICDRLGLPPEEAARLLWEAVWRGEVVCDGFGPLRAALKGGFAAGAPAQRKPASAMRRGELRRAFAAARAARPADGYFRLAAAGDAGEPSPLDVLELKKERVRILLGRYGIIFPALLAREARGFRWPDVFPALRVMDLSGEILSGIFFDGIPGLQFASAGAASRLSASGGGGRIFVLNARDPASLCGLDLPAAEDLPRRHRSADIVYRGDSPALVSEAGGRRLRFLLAPEDPDLPACVGKLLAFLRFRAPSSPVTVNRINGKSHRESPYAEALAALGFLRDYAGLSFWPPRI